MNVETSASRAASGLLDPHNDYYSGSVLPLVSGDVPAVEYLHGNGALGDGTHALILAAANGQLRIVQFLHRSGVDVRATACAALSAAAANGRTNVIRYLHQQGCDIRAGEDSPIRAAAGKAQIRALVYLHRNGADVRACAPVARALLSIPGSAPTVAYLARRGICPEGPVVIDLLRAIRARKFSRIADRLTRVDPSTYGGLVMMAATERDDVALLALLHQNGWDVRAGNDLALRRAAEKGHLNQLKYLHQVGGNIRSNGDLLLRLAAQSGHASVVTYLHRNGCSIKAVDEETLKLAQWSNAAVFNYLTECGADAIAEQRPLLTAMQRELATANSIYQPSKLWEFFNQINLEQLRQGGMNGFKRSVNQNYFNFVPLSVLDPQLISLLKYWVKRPNWTFLLLTLMDPDVDSRTGRLVSKDQRIFRLWLRYPGLRRVARWAQMLLYRSLIGMLWDFVVAHDKTDLSGTLAEPRLGSPIEITHRGRLISQDLGHSILEYNAFASVFEEIGRNRRVRIAEIGAGYGRLGYVLLKRLPCQYIVFDIPPSLAVSQWYLSETFPDKRVFRFRPIARFEDVVDELADADIAFFTANQISIFPDGFIDLSINISSLHELRPEQIDNMLAQMYRVASRFVYFKQYKEYVNPFDNLVISEEAYKTARGWQNRFHRTDETDSRFFEALIERETMATEGAALSAAVFEPSFLDRAKRAEKVATVSILLANYNHAQYLPTALAGIVGQTHPATEVIIVDDGSTDDSAAVIQDFRGRHPNIRLLNNRWNRGQHYSIQRALLEAKGDYIVWAASDDLLLPRFLEQSLAMLQKHPEAGLCFSRLSVFVDGASEVRHFIGDTHGAAFDYGSVPRFFSPRELDAQLRHHYVWISGNTVVARRAALLEIGGFERAFRWHADWFAYYVIALRYGACVIPETLALMRERHGTYSGGGISDTAEQGKVVKAIMDAIRWPKYADVRPYFERRPSLLSLFGKRGLIAAVRNPRYWRTAWSLTWWHVPRYIHVKYRTRFLPGLAARFPRIYVRASGIYRRMRRLRDR